MSCGEFLYTCTVSAELVLCYHFKVLALHMCIQTIVVCFIQVVTVGSDMWAY